MEKKEEISSKKQSLERCLDWLQKQNEQEPKKQSLQNKNDIQFIIQTNAERKKFLLAVAEDDATVPPGVDEKHIEPKVVPLNRLRERDLNLECGWNSCGWRFSDYDLFQKHVSNHISELSITEKNTKAEYLCLWDVCGHKTSDIKEMIRHINYHAYHAKLMAVGYNGRATLKLMRCNKDSAKRNHLPQLLSDHCCMWVGCELKFNSMQYYLDHVRTHTEYANGLCSWAGCGNKFKEKHMLTTHMRTHTGERVIACYHCGRQFANNRKLCDHLRRQNIHPNTNYNCSVCGLRCATEYLMRVHAKQHVCLYACTLCDMSAPSRAALANHVRYRHLPPDEARSFACPQCPYRAVTKCDLKKHIPVHSRKKRKKNENCSSDEEGLDTLSEVNSSQKEIPKKKYVCHICTKKPIVYSRGSRLTRHLVKEHGAQWPFGYSRFRYQKSEDGMYRLITTRIEVLEVSKKIVDGYSGPKESLENTFEFDLKKVAEATETTPSHFVVTLKDKSEEKKEKEGSTDNSVEIIMTDVDERGTIIKSETIKSGFL